jgi:hypothetical protein
VLMMWEFRGRSLVKKYDTGFLLFLIMVPFLVDF